MKKTIIVLVCVMLASSGAYAFIFHDPGAYTQRAAQVLQHMSKWSDQLGKMTTQIQKFQEYQQTFNRYYGTINSIYRKISHLSFNNLLNTLQGVYRDAQRLHDLLPGNEDYAHLESLDYLTANPLYEDNAEYRAYVDSLIERQNALVAGLSQMQQQLQAIRETQAARLDKFDEYEAANRAMSAGNGEASVTEQMALLNAIALEQARENHEIASMIRMVLERDLSDARTAVDHANQQGEANRDRPRNIEEILKMFDAGN